MSFGIAKDKDKLKSFVTESELEDKRKVRQAEWEKVRKPEQPLQCPDEPLDHRTLYDRLNEQKLKEQEEKDEARKMKNFVRGLEHDEVEFLDQVDDIYTKMEREKRVEEKRALMEFKVAALNVEKSSPDSGPPTPTLSAKRKDAPSFIFEAPRKKTQKDLLASVVKIKKPACALEEAAGPSYREKEDAVPQPISPAKLSVSPRSSLVAAYGSSSDSE